MAFKDNMRLEQIYFQNIKSTIDVLKSWKGETEDAKTTDIIDAVISCDSAVLLLYKNIGECWNELTAQIQKEMKDLEELKTKVENYHDELNEKIDDVNNYIMAIIREIEGRLDSLESRMDLVEDDLATIQRNRIFDLVYDETLGDWKLTYNDAVVTVGDVYELLVSEEGVLGNGWVRVYNEDDDNYTYVPVNSCMYDESDIDRQDVNFVLYTLTNTQYPWEVYLSRIVVDIDAYGTYKGVNNVYNFGRTEYMLNYPAKVGISSIGIAPDVVITLDTNNAPFLYGNYQITTSAPVSTYERLRYHKITAPKLRYNSAIQHASGEKIPYDCTITLRVFTSLGKDDNKLICNKQVNFKGVFGTTEQTTAQNVPTIEGIDGFMLDLGGNVKMYCSDFYGIDTLYFEWNYAVTINDVNQDIDLTNLAGVLVEKRLYRA